MIICSCNVLSDKQLRKVADEMRADPQGKVPTPGAVFRRLGCRPKCGNCFPNVVRLIHEQTAEDRSGENTAYGRLRLAVGA
ncbi:(2Fe-2S)-binding protein [Roseibium limicola]|uniref:(2Fe-2S)-binding protein n=1 Tax=Roseibium limicola TaxID=2816037 RepID=A0A939J703_9HYPH|nr:(2Fe-2S)-binding protein [Roseibium limicola]MBO0345652.1 (2Fe-2S)-binding protein [Roseibium limicola]